MLIRNATDADIPEIQLVYAHHVLHGTGTFDEVPPSVEDMTESFHAVIDCGWSWLVAVDATGVLGYAYFTQFRDRPAFLFTAEDSVYVREDVRGQGVGKLVAQLIEAATQADFRQMIAVIGDSANVSSVGVHASLGFRPAGTLRAAGLKLGQWLDVVYIQRQLGSAGADIAG